MSLQQISLYLQVLLYLAAGINHFVHPLFYVRIIPPYLPDASLLNTISGIAEIVLGIMLLFPATRVLAAFGIMAMLVAFIPAHIYMIQISKTPTALWISWLRLIPGQPLLIYWAYSLVKL